MNRLIARNLTQLRLPLLVAASACAAFAQRASTPVWVDVELAVTQADGRPAANAAVDLKLGDRGSFAPAADRDIATATDGNGIARFRAPAGVYGISVRIRGMGYGSIGATEYTPGTVVRPQMPRLAAYGAIEGTVPVETCKGDVVVHVNVAGEGQPDSKAVAGSFRAVDLPGGPVSLDAFTGERRCASWVGNLQPGQTLRDVKLEPVPTPRLAEPGPPSIQPPARSSGGSASPEESKKPVVWVRGTVRDEAGKPIASASVMALATFFGAIRMYEATSQTVTNADGYYELTGQGGLEGFSATVVAGAPGHPPAWAWPSFQDAANPPTQDLALASKSGRLQVTVLQQGTPAPGIAVALYLENANLRDTWAMPAGGASAIYDLVYPRSTTDERGVASFDNLLPGRYRIVASATADAVRASLRGFNQVRGLTAECDGIPVRAGEVSTHAMNIYQQQNEVQFKVMRPDGTPLNSESAAVEFGPVDSSRWSSIQGFDSAGLGKRDLDGGGLWQIRTTYRDSPVDSFPFPEPYFLAAGFVAASPNLGSGNVPVFTAHRVERGSVRIVVQDADGKPLKVTVQMNSSSAGEARSGTTDENGELVFAGLTSGVQYFVRLSSSDQIGILGPTGQKFYPRPAGSAAPITDENLWHLPDDWLAHLDNMRADAAIAVETFTAQSNTETRLVLRATPSRYIYGGVRFPADWQTTNWSVWLDTPTQSIASTRTWPNGQFVAGPFPPGDVRLYFGTTERAYHATVKVTGGSEPIHFDIDASKYADTLAGRNGPPVVAPDAVVLGIGGISSRAGGAQALTGKVLLADGQTPALGAQVLLFRSRQTIPSLLAMADALGNLQPRGLWQSGGGGVVADQSGPATPTVVAFLPGAAGATVQTLPAPGEELRLVLPAPISVSGRVTVGRSSPLRRPGVIHVVAEYRNDGFLKPYLSIHTTADAAGYFTLAGLTPGVYDVQAALDDIWLSGVSVLKVAGDATKPVMLDIVVPGAPTRVELKDSTGKPAVGMSITIDRQGPYATLWPREWTSDGAGAIRIPTLEAGRHWARVGKAGKPISFKVPPLPAEPLILRVKLE